MLYRYLLEKYGSLEAAWRRGHKARAVSDVTQRVELNPVCLAQAGFKFHPAFSALVES